MDVVKDYYSALKPERTFANVMMTMAGFLFASEWHINWVLLPATLMGTTLIVMSACAVNNCTDRDLDKRMPRTKKRLTATGQIPVRNLAVLAIILGVLGFVILAVWVNWLTVMLGVIGYIDYVVLYAWSKRTTPWSTLIGTVSGAVPLMAGYTAVTGHFALTTMLLGLVMVCWQMPHFYAIGIFRLKDYRAGNLPVWPVKFGVRNTQVWILLYTFLYFSCVLLLASIGSAGFSFASIAGLLALYWLWMGLRGFRVEKPVKWARGMFGFSLLVLLVFSAALVLSPLLP